jgi:DNA-binding CsgD family transcriptional regulator/PAS domain-containing protein
LKDKENILETISSSEQKLLMKILDHRAAETLNGFSNEFEDQLLRKTKSKSLSELLSRMHAELIRSPGASDQKEHTIEYWLNDPRVRRFQKLTDQAVRILDQSSGRYLYLNEANESISGLPNEAFMEKGLKYANLRTHPWDLFQLVLLVRKIMRSFKTLTLEQKLNSRFSFDLRYRHPERGYIRLQQHVLPLNIAKDGKPDVVMILSNDITELKSSRRMHFHMGVWENAKFRKIIEGKTSAYGNVLTAREQEVLSHVSDGQTSTQIAELMNLSPATVRTHTKNILAKTNCHNITQVVKLAVIEGWI